MVATPNHGSHESGDLPHESSKTSDSSDKVEKSSNIMRANVSSGDREELNERQKDEQNPERRLSRKTAGRGVFGECDIADVKICGKNKDVGVQLRNGLPEKIDTASQAWERDANNPQIWHVNEGKEQYDLKADVRIQGDNINASVKYENGREVTYQNGEAVRINHPDGEVWTRNSKDPHTWDVASPNKDDPSHPKMHKIKDVQVNTKDGDIKWHVDEGAGKGHDREIDASRHYHDQAPGESKHQNEMPPVAPEIVKHQNEMPPVAPEIVKHQDEMPPVAPEIVKHQNEMPPVAPEIARNQQFGTAETANHDDESFPSEPLMANLKKLEAHQLGHAPVTETVEIRTVIPENSPVEPDLAKHQRAEQPLKPVAPELAKYEPLSASSEPASDMKADLRTFAQGHETHHPELPKPQAPSELHKEAPMPQPHLETAQKTPAPELPKPQAPSELHKEAPMPQPHLETAQKTPAPELPKPQPHLEARSQAVLPDLTPKPINFEKHEAPKPLPLPEKSDLKMEAPLPSDLVLGKNLHGADRLSPHEQAAATISKVATANLSIPALPESAKAQELPVLPVRPPAVLLRGITEGSSIQPIQPLTPRSDSSVFASAAPAPVEIPKSTASAGPVPISVDKPHKVAEAPAPVRAKQHGSVISDVKVIPSVPEPVHEQPKAQPGGHEQQMPKLAGMQQAKMDNSLTHKSEGQEKAQDNPAHWDGNQFKLNAVDNVQAFEKPVTPYGGAKYVNPDGSLSDHIPQTRFNASANRNILKARANLEGHAGHDSHHQPLHGKVQHERVEQGAFLSGSANIHLEGVNHLVPVSVHNVSADKGEFSASLPNPKLDGKEIAWVGGYIDKSHSAFVITQASYDLKTTFPTRGFLPLKRTR